MGSLFNLRTILRAVFGLVGAWLVSMPCATPEETCITKIVGSALVALGLSIGSSAASIKAAKGGPIP